MHLRESRPLELLGALSGPQTPGRCWLRATRSQPRTPKNFQLVQKKHPLSNSWLSPCSRWCTFQSQTRQIILSRAVSHRSFYLSLLSSLNPSDSLSLSILLPLLSSFSPYHSLSPLSILLTLSLSPSLFLSPTPSPHSLSLSHSLSILPIYIRSVQMV